MSPSLEWIDTHCHVYEDDIPGGQVNAIAAAREAGVSKMIVIGTDAETTQQAIAIAAQHENVWATVGLHPHDAKMESTPLRRFLVQTRLSVLANADLTTTTTTPTEPCNAKYLLHKFS